MKSISGILEVLQFLEALNLGCDEFLLFLRAVIYPKSQNSESLKFVKISLFVVSDQN